MISLKRGGNQGSARTGVGIEAGYATLGRIGFAGRYDYGVGRSRTSPHGSVLGLQQAES